MFDNKTVKWINGEDDAVCVRSHIGLSARIDCPLCGFEYVHIIGVEAVEDERFAVGLKCDCEGCGVYYVTLRNREGYTMARVERERE